MYPNPDLLLHLCEWRAWEAARDCADLCPPSLTEVGFVHLSTCEQVHLPANRLFAGRTDMLLLEIDPRLLTAPLRWEPGVATDPEAMVFPHLYGPLPVSAVTAVRPYLPSADGSFAALRGS